MAKMLSKKFKKKATWKPVEISGNFITDDFEGFAGLEVLENYDQAFLTGDYSRNGNVKAGIYLKVHIYLLKIFRIFLSVSLIVTSLILLL